MPTFIGTHDGQGHICDTLGEPITKYEIITSWTNHHAGRSRNAAYARTYVKAEIDGITYYGYIRPGHKGTFHGTTQPHKQADAQASQSVHLDEAKPTPTKPTETAEADRPVADLKLPAHLHKTLERLNIKTIGQFKSTLPQLAARHNVT